MEVIDMKFDMFEDYVNKKLEKSGFVFLSDGIKDLEAAERKSTQKRLQDAYANKDADEIERCLMMLAILDGTNIKPHWRYDETDNKDEIIDFGLFERTPIITFKE
jgi:hypothetical protein